ncbi:hypothetical protein L207DRAFT_628829 [Hyaloscypha variabilis F]|uniref:Uncharacterized protein n=1 Tax=Hyaloscypha variabilis (strain UAMH 11265 / GT02V1 / F) TaxID=1149755 RepID=A0A2J6S659_HYAVF|nr:hypothetical protein L207DRAFT_628829 [Hyaloscypha variabilis F]
MDQPSLSPKEQDVPISLSENVPSGVSVLIPPNPINEPNVSESNEYVTIAGLKVPQYAHGFLGIAFAVTYENFVVCLTELNPKTLTRPAAEQAWLEIVHQSYREWSPCPEEYTDQEKKDLRKKATAQIHGQGLKGFDVEQFWGKRESGSTRTEVRAKRKKIRKSDERANMDREEYADRKEKKRNWRAVQNLDAGSSMTLSMRSKTAESEEAVESVSTGQKLEQDG